MAGKFWGHVYCMIILSEPIAFGAVCLLASLVWLNLLCTSLQIKQVSPQKSAAVTSSGEPPLPSKGEQKAQPSSLLEGTYDEASSAKSFQEALAEWRNGKNAESAANTFAARGISYTEEIFFECAWHSLYIASSGGIFPFSYLDSATETTSDVATMAESTHEPRGTEFNVVFADGKTKVSYFEKLLMRKYKDGTITMQPSSPHPVLTEIESDEELEHAPAISKYNVFYDADDIDGNDANGVPIPSVNCDEDFPVMASRPRPSSVSIEELTSDGEVLPLPEPEIVLRPCGKEVIQMQKKGSHSSKKIAEAKDSKMASEPTEVKSGKTGKHRDRGESGHRKKSKEKEQLPAPLSTSHNEKGREVDQQYSEIKAESLLPSSHEHDTQFLKQSDLLVSVRSAWDNCTEFQHSIHQLGHFFLHAVQPVNSEEAASPEPPVSVSTPHFKLGSTVWLPSSSTAQEEPVALPSISESAEPPPSVSESAEPPPSVSESAEPPPSVSESAEPPPSVSESAEPQSAEPPPSVSESAEPPPSVSESAEPPTSISESAEPPPSRPSTRDWYYDDSDSSDSEPQNEGDEFIQSRMGMVRDSVDCRVSRPATSTSSRDLEVEDQVERDKDDCQALDELAWELASTVECEGRLSRCERDLDTEETEGGCDAVTPVPVANEGEDEVGVADKQVMDMSEVISEFELYQQRLMEEDSDEEQ